MLALTISVAFTNSDKLLSVLFICFAFFLTSIPDIIDLRLGLGRMNTVFKFYFQAWLFFALGSSILTFHIFKKIKTKKLLFILTFIVIGIFFVAALTYPLTSSIAKINDKMGSNRKPTLDGTDYMKSSAYFDNNHAISLIYDFDAINWINKNIKGNPVILEANTPIYRWGNRISVYTGLPTVLGWDWHEIAHRQYMTPDQIQIRANHIREIYTSYNFETTKNFLMLYNVSYIYLGELEKAYYDTSGFERVVNNNVSYFQKAYISPNVIIYKFLDGKYY